MFFRSNPKKLAEKASKEKGNRLRKLCKAYHNQAMLGEAAELVEQFGDDPLVINCSGYSGNTPIYHAVLNRHHELACKIATATGFNAGVLNGRKQTILLYALRRSDNSSLVHELVKRSDLNINAKDDMGDFALLAASSNIEYYNYLPAILEKTDHTIAFDSISTFGSWQSPLYEMVWVYLNEHPTVDKPTLLKCITDLLNLPFCMDKKKLKSRQHALDYSLLNAAMKGNTTVVSLLLNAGASTECKDRDDHNAYQLAKYNGHTETALLIDNRFRQPPSAPPAEINLPPASIPAPEASAPPLSLLDKSSNVVMSRTL